MSSLYERWQPSVGDRVRIVERNETGAASLAGQSGTIVALHADEPEALCEVRYDGASTNRETHRHAAAELEPIGTKASTAEPWEPTVGDRVIAPGGREATITAIDERPDGTACEVEYNHRPVRPPTGASYLPPDRPDADAGAVGRGAGGHRPRLSPPSGYAEGVASLRIAREATPDAGSAT